MKKTLLSFCMALISLAPLFSQCVPTCSNYILSPITFTTFTSAGTNAIPMFAPSIDDGTTVPVPLGFSFNFYCFTYTSVIICSNGFLQFDIGSPPNVTFANPAQSFPDPTSPNGIVALNMTDLDANVSGTITFTTIGIPPNQKFILTYSNVPIWTSPQSLHTGQIVLYETSNIIEIYTGGVTNSSPYQGTQGIEDGFGTVGSTVPGRSYSFWGASSSAYQWSPYSIVPPAAITGNTLVCQGSPQGYTVSTTPGALSYNWSFPQGWSGIPSSTLLPVITGASGTLSVSATFTCGTSQIITLSVTTMPAPFISIPSITPNVVCAGNSVTINGSGAATYTLNPGNIVANPPYTAFPPSTTVYSLNGTSAAGCEGANTATAQVLVNPTPTLSVNSGTICLGNSFTITPSGAAFYTVSSAFGIETPTMAGTYTYSVKGASGVGCPGTPVVSTLIAYPLPSVTAVPNRTTICRKENVSITAGGATSYSWNPITSSSTILVVSPTVTTMYALTGVDSKGCVNSTSVTINVNTCSGFGETFLTEALEISVYPNPSAGEFTFLTPRAMTVKIYDVGGKIIFEKEIGEAGKYLLNLNNNAQGIYFLKAISDNIEKNLVLVRE